MFITRNQYTLLTHLFFLVMAVFAIVFAKERFQADGAYYLMQVIDSGNFRIEHQRYILAASQLFPLIGVKLGLPMNGVILLNSLNNVIFFYLVFCYCVYYLRDRTAGIAVILFQVLGVLHLQFTPMYEIWYGSVLLVPFHSHLRFERFRRPADFLFFVLISITILFSHPLLFIPVIFLLLFDAMERWFVHWKVLLSMILVFAIWFTIKKLFLSSYEAGKVSMLDLKTNKAYRDLLHPGYWWFLFKFFFTWYTIPVLLFLCTIVFQWVRGVKRKAVLMLLFFLGHILLINVTHVMDPFLTPYFERMYMPLVAICILPFLYDAFVQISLTNNVGLALLLVIITWRVGRFVDVGIDYKHRTQKVEHIIEVAQTHPGSKFELSKEDYTGCMKGVDWSFAMETMLRSGYVDPQHTVTIAIYDDFIINNNQSKLNDQNFMFNMGDIRPDTKVNANYFKILPGPYTLLEPACN